jgi:derlin-1
MIGYDFLMSGGIPKAGIVGILSSHIYYYLTTIYPRQGGRRYLQTPQFLRALLPGNRRNFNSGNATPQRQTNMFGRHSWGSGQRLGS